MRPRLEGARSAPPQCAGDFSPEPRGAAFLPPMRDKNVAPTECDHGVTVTVTGSANVTSSQYRPAPPEPHSSAFALTVTGPVMKRGAQSLPCIRFPAVVS